MIIFHAGLQSDYEIQLLWITVFTSGDVAGIYWALVTHPNATEKFPHKIYGDVHMLSHFSGATARTDIKLLGKLRRDKSTVEKELKEKSEALSRKLYTKYSYENLLTNVRMDFLESIHFIKNADLISKESHGITT